MEKETKAEPSSDAELSIAGKSVDEDPNPQGEGPTFPEGGLRAWSVAIGCAGLLFSTFGYVNAFGYCTCSILYVPVANLTKHISVFQQYYQTHQLRHESPSTISWIGSLQIFFLFGGNLVGGPMFDRFGAKVSAYRNRI